MENPTINRGKLIDLRYASGKENFNAYATADRSDIGAHVDHQFKASADGLMQVELNALNSLTEEQLMSFKQPANIKLISLNKRHRYSPFIDKRLYELRKNKRRFIIECIGYAILILSSIAFIEIVAK